MCCNNAGHRRPITTAPVGTRRLGLAAACLVPVVARACYKRGNHRPFLIFGIANYMITRRPVKEANQLIVGVIASPADLRFAVTMHQPPDLFELRLDHLCGMLGPLERKMSILSGRRGEPAPVIITARDPREGGANNLSFQQRLGLLFRFLPYAKDLDVRLRSARRFKCLLERARKQDVRRIISFHNFKSTPPPRRLRAKPPSPKPHAPYIFKTATPTNTPPDLAP